MPTRGERIKKARKAIGLKQRELAKNLGVAESTVSRWENDGMDIDLANASALADALGVTVGYLEGRDEVGPLGAGSPATSVPVVGEVQAGVWREAAEWDHDDQYPILAVVPPEYSKLLLRAYVVRGNSMNQYYPNGSHVIVASTIANGIRTKHGNKVLVSRRNKDGMYEATLKEYVVSPDGSVWLWPRSTSPEHQAPIQYRDDNTEEVTITGVVAMAQITERLF